MPVPYTFSTTLTPDSSLLDSVLATLWSRPDTTNGSGVTQNSTPFQSPAPVAINGLGGGHALQWGNVSVGMRAIHGGDVNNAGLALTVGKAGVSQVDVIRIFPDGSVAVDRAAATNRVTVEVSAVAGGFDITSGGYGALSRWGITSPGVDNTPFIGSVAGNAFALYANNAEQLRVGTTGHLTPAADNTQNLGSSAKRYAVVYAGTGTINTSDAREKTAVRPLCDAELAAAKDLAREIGVFRFLSAVALKGGAARMHIGLTVQRAMEVMAAHGLDPLAYGFICHDEWSEHVERSVNEVESEGDQPARSLDARVIAAGDRFGFRSDELLLFVMRGLEARLTALEA